MSVLSVFSSGEFQSTPKIWVSASFSLSLQHKHTHKHPNSSIRRSIVRLSIPTCPFGQANNYSLFQFFQTPNCILLHLVDIFRQLFLPDGYIIRRLVRFVVLRTFVLSLCLPNECVSVKSCPQDLGGYLVRGRHNDGSKMVPVAYLHFRVSPFACTAVLHE